MLQATEIVITEPGDVGEEYRKRGVYRYIMVPESLNICERTIVAGGAVVLPAGQLVEIFDIPVPYHDSDSLEDEHENAEVAAHNRQSPTGGAKFKPKTSYAIVDELIQNYAVRGLVYFAELSTMTQQGRKEAAIVEAKLNLESLFDPKVFPTLQDALAHLEEISPQGIPHGADCLSALKAGLEQAIAFRQSWAISREADIQLGLKGKGGRVATFQNEREYAASIGIGLTNANEMKPIEAVAVAAAGGSSSSDLIATKFLLEQNEALARENAELKEQQDAMAANMNAIMKKLKIKPEDLEG